MPEEVCPRFVAKIVIEKAIEFVARQAKNDEQAWDVGGWAEPIAAVCAGLAALSAQNGLVTLGSDPLRPQWLSRAVVSNSALTDRGVQLLVAAGEGLAKKALVCVVVSQTCAPEYMAFVERLGVSLVSDLLQARNSVVLGGIGRGGLCCSRILSTLVQLEVSRGEELSEEKLRCVTLGKPLDRHVLNFDDEVIPKLLEKLSCHIIAADDPYPLWHPLAQSPATSFEASCIQDLRGKHEALRSLPHGNLVLLSKARRATQLSSEHVLPDQLTRGEWMDHALKHDEYQALLQDLLPQSISPSVTLKKIKDWDLRLVYPEFASAVRMADESLKVRVHDDAFQNARASVGLIQIDHSEAYPVDFSTGHIFMSPANADCSIQVTAVFGGSPVTYVVTPVLATDGRKKWPGLDPDKLVEKSLLFVAMCHSSGEMFKHLELRMGLLLDEVCAARKDDLSWRTLDLAKREVVKQFSIQVYGQSSPLPYWLAVVLSIIGVATTRFSQHYVDYLVDPTYLKMLRFICAEPFLPGSQLDDCTIFELESKVIKKLREPRPFWRKFWFSSYADLQAGYLRWFAALHEVQKFWAKLSIISVVGRKDAGKSSCLRGLFGVENVRFGSDEANATRSVTAFAHPNVPGVYVLDTPGLTEASISPSVRRALREQSKLANTAVILVCNAKIEAPEKKLFEEIQSNDGVKPLIIVCLNQIDRFFAKLKEEKPDFSDAQLWELVEHETQSSKMSLFGDDADDVPENVRIWPTFLRLDQSGAPVAIPNWMRGRVRGYDDLKIEIGKAVGHHGQQNFGDGVEDDEDRVGQEFIGFMQLDDDVAPCERVHEQLAGLAGPKVWAAYANKRTPLELFLTFRLRDSPFDRHGHNPLFYRVSLDVYGFISSVRACLPGVYHPQLPCAAECCIMDEQEKELWGTVFEKDSKTNLLILAQSIELKLLNNHPGKQTVRHKHVNLLRSYLSKEVAESVSHVWVDTGSLDLAFWHKYYCLAPVFNSETQLEPPNWRDLLCSLQRTLLQMIDFSYLMSNCSTPDLVRLLKGREYEDLAHMHVRREEILASLVAQGWEISFFEGLSATNIKKDTFSKIYCWLLGKAVEATFEEEFNFPGFLAVNSRQRLVVINMHGSRSGADWATNGDFDPLDEKGYKELPRALMRLHLEFIGGPQFTLKGKCHKGFAVYYLALKQNLEKCLERVRTQHSAIWHQLRFVFCGHSLGAAVSQIAAVDFCLDYATRNHIRSHQIGGYYVSTPCWLDSKALAITEDLFVPSAHINQFVGWDLVVLGTDTIPKVLNWKTMMRKRVGLDVEQSLEYTLEASKQSTERQSDGQREIPKKPSLFEKTQIAHMASKRFSESLQFDPDVVRSLAELLPKNSE